MEQSSVWNFVVGSLRFARWFQISLSRFVSSLRFQSRSKKNFSHCVIYTVLLAKNHHTTGCIFKERRRNHDLDSTTNRSQS